MSGGGKSAGNQKVETGPPKWMRPYIRGIYGQAGNLYNNSTFFPGQTYAGFSPDQQLYQQLGRERALQGTNPIFGDVNSQLSSTLQGDYLYGGEGFNAAYNAAANKIIPQTDSAFARAGRSGSGLAAAAQTSALGDAFAGLYGQERQRQMQAAGLAPQVAQAQQGLDWMNLSFLNDIGSQQQMQEQRGIDEAMARHDFPWTNLQRYAGIVGGLSGAGGQVQSTPMYRNRLSGALGGGMLGSYFGPWGMVGGGILGGLLS